MTRTNLAAAGSTTGPRVARLRGDASLARMLGPGEGSEVARLELSTRDSTHVGDPIRVEVSFGPLTDEVEIDGWVARIQGANDGPSRVLVAFGPEQAPRVEYLRHVLAGRRSASARRHRRIPVDLDVRWSHGRARYASKLRDLSRGGAFILSQSLPRIGDTVEVEILDEDERHALQLQAIVSWVRPQRPAGFGVSFRLTSRNAAAALTDVVRRQERNLSA